MSWIKENKFIAALGGGTLLGVILLYLVGSSGASRYETAKENYTAASDAAKGFERLPLYPKAENRDGKRKAIDDYRKSIDSLQAIFEPFRPKELKNSTPQEFTNQLLAANTDTRKAFEEAGTTVPEAYFAGFEGYRTSMARSNSTGILGYELDAIKNLMLELAKAKPTALNNLHRPALPEEEGQAFTPSATAVARSFPLEITFTGSEKAARAFISAVNKPDNKYAVIRTIRILNEKKTPPLSTDAKFDTPAPAKAAAAAASDTGGFVFPGQEEAAPAAPEATPAPAAPAAPKAGDTGRILAQVLGNEQVHVFVRLDLLQFLPVKKLP